MPTRLIAKSFESVRKIRVLWCTFGWGCQTTVAVLLTGTFSFHICRNVQAGMAQGRPWGYLWAYRSPNFWPSGGFHLLPWVGQRTFPSRRARGALVENAAALIWVLHPGASRGAKGPSACLPTPGGALANPRALQMGPGVVYKKSMKIHGISIWNSLSSVDANCKSHFCFSYFINVPIFLDRFL